MWMIYPLIFLSGFVDSIAGGGGLISLPAYIAVGLPAHTALGTNKFSAVLGTGISAGRFAKNGYVRWGSALLSFLGALAGSALGARLSLMLDERFLTYILIAMVPVIGIFLFVKKDFGVQEREISRTKTVILSLVIGFVIGGYDGFFGPGTGTFLILAFTGLMGFSLLHSCGNAKMVNFASNIAAVITFIMNGEVDYKLGIPCVLCGIAGNYLGAGLAMKRGTKIVRPMMIVVIIILLAKIIWDLF